MKDRVHIFEISSCSWTTIFQRRFNARPRKVDESEGAGSLREENSY